MFYVSGHTGVLYSPRANTQQLLIGHTAPITACATSRSRRTLFTADSGPGALVIAWDGVSGDPMTTIALPEGMAARSLSVSPDGERVAVLSDGNAQELAIYDMVDGEAVLVASAAVDVGDAQMDVRFAPDSADALISTGRQRVVFWTVNGAELTFYSPPMSQRDLRQSVGHFTVSAMLPASTSAVTATVDGDCILWAETAAPEAAVADRRAVKVVRLHSGAAITCVEVVDGFLVTAATDGYVRFYDYEFRIVAWFEELDAGPVRALSFAATDAVPGPGPYAKATAKAGTLRCPPFIVASTAGLIVGADDRCFEEADEVKRRGTLLVQGFDAAVTAVAAHPEAATVAAVTASSSLILFDVDARRLSLVRAFAGKVAATALAFSADGSHIAVGFASGYVRVVLGDSLADVASFKPSSDAVSRLAFSADGTHFAAATKGTVLSLFRWAHRDDDTTRPLEWVHVGNHRAHYKPITDLKFGTAADGLPELATIGEDRYLALVDLPRSSVTGGVVLKARARVAHSSVPTACMFADMAGEGGMGRCVVVATSDGKLRFFDQAERTIGRTALAPTYGGRIGALVPLPAAGVVAFACAEKAIGLMGSPLDGAPQRAMAFIAHGGAVESLAAIADGRTLCSAGGEDLCLSLTRVRTEAMPPAPAPGAVEPFLDLLEGGADGPLAQDIVNYFTYLQIRVQGEDSKEPRTISGSIPISDIASLARALGYYPSEAEAAEMAAEAASMNMLEDGVKRDHVTLADFVRLYVSHRPVDGVGQADIDAAFKALLAGEKHMTADRLAGALTSIGAGPGPGKAPEGADGEGGPPACERVGRGRGPLTSSPSRPPAGEPLRPEELAKCLESLTGRTSGLQAADPASFARDVLGFEQAQTVE